MKRLQHTHPIALLIALLLAWSNSAAARVLRVEVLNRTALDATASSPAYEKIAAIVYFAVRPTDAHNRGIVDLDKAPRNPQGEVEFSADLFLLRPLDKDKSNGSLLLEIPNRGGKGILSLIDGGKPDPATPGDLGDAWLLRQGFTFASLGWQWDVVETPGALRLYAPVAVEFARAPAAPPRRRRGAQPPKEPAAATGHITGLLRDDFTPFEPAKDEPLGHITGAWLGGTEYPVANPSDTRNTLTVRDSPHGPRHTIPAAQWRFAHQVNGVLAPSDRFVHLDQGFEPGRIYELIYVVRDPVVAGLGFAAVRDFASWLKHAPDAIAPVHQVYAAGISQCGRFLRDLLYQGFNADEKDQIALDGVLAHVGGAGRGSFNVRFAQPSRDGQPMSSIDYPTDIFPFTDTPERDPLSPKAPAEGLLDSATAHRVVPKIFLSHTSYEYWGRAASLIHTTADGLADSPQNPSLRIYFYSGLQHYSVPFPPQPTTGGAAAQQLPSPLPIRWFWRAMIANMDSWVRSGTAPPPSRYPHIDDGTLVPIEKLAFPAIPGLFPPASANKGWRLDFGPEWRKGELTQQPPIAGAPFPVRVPQVDSDGNDRGGIALPEIAVPLATYTGWNFRAPSIGAPSERPAFLGSFVPLHATAAEATSAHDPRPAVLARYKDYADYRERFSQALNSLIKDHYILEEDREQLIDRSQQEWNWIVKPAARENK